MSNLIPLNRIPHRVSFHSECLIGYRTQEQLSFAMSILRIRAGQFAEQMPFANHQLSWPPPFGMFPDLPRGHPALRLYDLLYNTVGQCGFPVTALEDIEVISHDPKSLTVIELNKRRQVISVQ
jgi:hypothetical protein